MDKLLEQGVLGILLFLSVTANIWFVKEIRKMHSDRIEDYKSSFKEALIPVQNIKSMFENIVFLLEQYSRTKNRESDEKII